MRDVVVTAVGEVTPLGAGARALHERPAAGTSAIRDGEAPCADFDPTAHSRFVALSNSFGSGGHNATLCAEAA